MDLKKLPEQEVSLEEQIQELERELALRERVYPKWIEAGRMSQREAQQRYLALRAALTTLRSGGRGHPSERAHGGGGGLPAVIVRGDFLRGLSDPNGLVAAPTNGAITPGGLVMGAGAALALAQRRPALKQALARRIEREGVREGRFWRYGFVAVRLEDRLYGAFQTKLDFRQGADLGLIRYSAERLRAWLEAHPTPTVHLAFPGIGLGGLEPEAVLGVLEEALGPVHERVRLYRK